MSHQYSSEIHWERGSQLFTDNLYSRKHRLVFDGGIEVAGSSSPLIVAEPYSDPQAVDPEEAFIAALSSCHMLWFLSLAAKKAYIVDSYHDHAIGLMTQNEQKKLWISSVTLQPKVIFSGKKQPDATTLLQLHHQAHEECFIANSVKTQLEICPRST